MVELDRWVRREEYRVHQNIIKLRKVKQLARGVAALGGAGKKRRGSMVTRLTPSSPEASLKRAGARVRRASFGSVRVLRRGFGPAALWRALEEGEAAFPAE